MDPTVAIDQNDTGPSPRSSYTWIAPPLLILLAVALAATAFQLRRRRRAARRLAAARPQGGADGDRGSEAGGGGTDPEHAGAAAGPRDVAVEGLDERGEAPPPYKPPGAKKGDDLEMGRLPGYEDDEGGVAVPPAAVTHPR